MSTHETQGRKEEFKTPSDKSFGWVFTVFFLVIAFLPLIKHHSIHGWAIVVSVVFAVVTLVCSRLLHPLNVIWTKFGLLLHAIISPIVLGIIFYVAVVPTGLVMRVFGKDFLRLKKDVSLKSYWLSREGNPVGSEDIKNQF